MCLKLFDHGIGMDNNREIVEAYYSVVNGTSKAKSVEKSIKGSSTDNKTQTVEQITQTETESVRPSLSLGH